MATQTQVATLSTHLAADDQGGVLTPIGLTDHNISSGDSSSSPVRGSRVSNLRKIAIIVQLSGVSFTCGATNGLVVVCLPAITSDLGLPPSLAFWPTSVASLANASTLLLAGSIADCIGARTVNLAGCFLSGAFMLAAGFSQNGAQLVGMRALQGVGSAMYLASSVGITSRAFTRGRSRNFAFGCLGMSSPLGFSFGLVLGGLLQQALGWRAGWYIYGSLTLLLSTVAIWALPTAPRQTNRVGRLHEIKSNVDWVGAILASTFMALISYLFATLSSDPSKVRNPESISFICLSAVAAPSFIYWCHRQVRHGKPALIPNSLWKDIAFSSICVTMALSFGVVTSMELFASLFFQEVQQLSALQAGLRILPSLVVGVILNATTGLYVDRVSAKWIVGLSSLVCAGAPLLMAVAQPQWPYWANAFVAQILAPVSADVLFTIGLIVISDVFPDDTQALAGAVFNTASQFGQALCLGVMQIVSTLVTRSSDDTNRPLAVLTGLRASFWTMFGFMMLCGVLGILGLRNTGRVGLKRD